MITNKFYGVREAVIAAAVLVAFALMGFGTAFAQTTSSFTPPAGYYQDLSRPGIYFSEITGQFYNPMTGQYSNLTPMGPATMNQGGQYNVPSGYSQYNNGNYYYNSQSGYYYDPSTGFYSTSAPINTGVTAAMAQNYTAPTMGTTGGYTTPGVPNTGAGGSATTTLVLLALLAAVAATGSVYLGRKIV